MNLQFEHALILLSNGNVYVHGCNNEVEDMWALTFLVAMVSVGLLFRGELRRAGGFITICMNGDELR